MRPMITVCNYLKAVSNFFSNMESTNFYLWVFLRESKAPTYFLGFLCKNEKHQLLLLGFFAVKKSNKLLKKWTFLCQSPEISPRLFWKHARLLSVQSPTTCCTQPCLSLSRHRRGKFSSAVAPPKHLWQPAPSGQVPAAARCWSMCGNGALFTSS